MLAKAADGAQIQYEVYDFTDPWKPSDTILLHHGLRMTKNMWYAWIPHLAQSYRVVTINARGRGESTVPEPGFNWNLEQCTTDVFSVMDDIGVDTFHWLGTSFGSVVGQYAGAHHAERLKTLILLSSPYRFDHLKHVIDEWIAEYDELGSLGFLRRDIKRMFPEDADPDMLEWYAQEMNDVPPHAAKEMLAFIATINLADILKDISVPTLILAAKHSDRAPSTEAEYMNQQIPDSELVVFDGHHNINETNLAGCLEAVDSFLERRSHGT